MKGTLGSVGKDPDVFPGQLKDLLLQSREPSKGQEVDLRLMQLGFLWLNWM